MKIAIGIACIVFAAFILLSLKESNAKVVHPDDKSRSLVKVLSPKQLVYPDANPFTNQAIKEFESFIKTVLANKQAPGAALAIVKDTTIIFLKGYGMCELGKPDSVNARTVFRVGSVSKSITATLASILVEEGVIHWDDQVIKYLPSFKLKTEEATKKLTLRHLLSHTEGLPYHAYTNLVESRVHTDTIINNLRGLNLIAEPGKIHSYQNVGFSLIGKVIEAATKKSFEEVLIEKLFQPLKMEDASASYEKIAASKNVAKPHRLTRPSKISDTYYSVAPAGGINASAQDMALWLKEILTLKSGVLSEDQIDEIFKPQVDAITRNLYFYNWKKVRKPFYGLGWRVVTFNDDTIAYHGGFVNNYRCEVAVNRKKKIAIALLVNSPGMLADQGIPKFFKIYDSYLDSIRKWKPKPAL